MQTCNPRFRAAHRSRAILAVLCALAAGTAAFAQGAPSLPSMPELSMPSMPTISAPTMPNGYYSPGSQQRGTASATEGTAPAAARTDSATVSSPVAGIPALESLSSLTASDIQLLSANGLLDSVLDTGLLPQAGTGSDQAAKETNELLQQMLTEIQQLKNQGSTGAATTAPTAQAARRSRLIRFSVNGYDILHTCRTIYISDVQADGTFLVTGDRRYASDGKTRTETFHILFTRSEADGGLLNYTAAAAVTQDYLNEYSFLYQLSERQGLSALRTGNLVTMRTADPDWKLEMLIDLGDGK